MTSTTVSASSATATSVWPAPTVSIRITSNEPESLEQARDVARRAGDRPVRAAAGEAAHEDVVAAQQVRLHPHAVAEHRAAADRARRVDREHRRRARPPSRRTRSAAPVSVLLPAPGGPVMPTTWTGRSTGRDAQTCHGGAVLDQRDRARERAPALGPSPWRASSASTSVCADKRDLPVEDPLRGSRPSRTCRCRSAAATSTSAAADGRLKPVSSRAAVVRGRRARPARCRAAGTATTTGVSPQRVVRDADDDGGGDARMAAGDRLDLGRGDVDARR